MTALGNYCPICGYVILRSWVDRAVPPRGQELDRCHVCWVKYGWDAPPSDHAHMTQSGVRRTKKGDKMRRTRQGFSLIEALMVVVVVSILIILVVASVNATRRSTRTMVLELQPGDELVAATTGDDGRVLLQVQTPAGWRLVTVRQGECTTQTIILTHTPPEADHGR